jgi:Kef-type K+ transport system membrane component KefB/nucleotide-binding universal stress UspA family protein
MTTDHSIAVFIAELILLLAVGRLLGEALSRVGQPAIFGQLLAGVLLGPSVFGALLPDARQLIFPGTPALKSMIDAVSQIGVLLLLLLTGMETNLALVSRRRRAVISTSLCGIGVPFFCGVLLAYALPRGLVPTSGSLLVTALFLGTALSISSVKIVAMVLMEVGAIRRDLGQLILATAILDDTIAWVMIAVIAGIAAHGTISLGSISATVAGTAVFLGLSLTVGRRVVAHIIRWSNDSLTTEVPVITAILVVMLAMALTTELIGVHTALGAFVAGMLVGQSPILTEHIEDELRGFILAFFSPVFFAVAGLGMDLRTLLDPTLLLFTVAVVAVASVGKFSGAILGGRLGGLTGPESLALATALNARGSTEVIIASIGLAMGALSKELYTMIVAMAVVTTMAMPPTLRWMLARVPLGADEAKRLEKEAAEEGESVPRMERALIYADRSANGLLAARLGGMFGARQQVMLTVMERATAPGCDRNALSVRDLVAKAALDASARTPPSEAESVASAPPMTIEELLHVKPIEADDTLEKEAAKGYSIVFVGVDTPLSSTPHRFEDQLQRLAAGFSGPLGIVFNAKPELAMAASPLRLLVPTGGTAEARMATEIALALAKGSDGAVTALHVFDPRDDGDQLRGRRRQGLSLLVDARRLGKRSGVEVTGLTLSHSRPETAIERAARSGTYDLIVVGTSLRQGDKALLGPRSTALIGSLRMPILLIVK